MEPENKGNKGKQSPEMDGWTHLTPESKYAVLFSHVCRLGWIFCHLQYKES